MALELQNFILNLQLGQFDDLQVSNSYDSVECQILVTLLLDFIWQIDSIVTRADHVWCLLSIIPCRILLACLFKEAIVETIESFKV